MGHRAGLDFTEKRKSLAAEEYTLPFLNLNCYSRIQSRNRIIYLFIYLLHQKINPQIFEVAKFSLQLF